MDISIIVLTYNQDKTIVKTIDSILNQKIDADFEIIIGDDSSTDNTKEICEELCRKFPDKIKYIRREKNVGLVANYYDCFSRCQGNYIADCSGDDYWVDENKLQKQYSYLETHPEVTLVGGEWICKNISTGEITSQVNMAPCGEYDNNNLIDIFLNTISFSISASLYRKDVIEEKLKKNPEILNNHSYSFEDLQIVLACAQAGKIVMLPGVVLNYSIGHESVSHKQDFTRQYFYTLKALQQLKDLQIYFLTELDEKGKCEINKFFKAKGDFLTVMAFKSGRNKFKTNPITELERLDKGWKGTFYSQLMKKESFWKISLKLWKILFPHKFKQ